MNNKIIFPCNKYMYLYRPITVKLGKFGQNKNYFSQVYGHNLVKYVINGANLVKIGHFW